MLRNYYITILLNNVIKKSLFIDKIGLKPETIEDCYLSNFIEYFYHIKDLEELERLIF